MTPSLRSTASLYGEAIAFLALMAVLAMAWA
jgi:hypothetical protein